MKLYRSVLAISTVALLSIQLVNANQNSITEEFKQAFIPSFQAELKNGCIASTMAQGVSESKRDEVTQFCSCVSGQSKSMLNDEMIIQLLNNQQNPAYMQQFALKLMQTAAPKCM